MSGPLQCENTTCKCLLCAQAMSYCQSKAPQPSLTRLCHSATCRAAATHSLTLLLLLLLPSACRL